jgi:AraC family transcriptional regulator
MSELSIADRGSVRELQPPSQTSALWAVVSRLGSLRLSAPAASLWLQLRGSTAIEAREGRFVLRRGDWIAFEADSAPRLLAQRSGVAGGVVLPPELWDMLARGFDHPVPGRGRLASRDQRIVLRLWREATRAHAQDPGTTLRTLLSHFASLQPDLEGLMRHCPGRSRRRKRQVLARMQRARLHLEGNPHRVVRIGELASMASLSVWYFSKTFHALYGVSPQAYGLRMRIEHAARLLADTSLTVSEIAENSGFENCCSFTRAFRAHAGMPPTHYRALLAQPMHAHEAHALRHAATR